jgi:uncharacterized membrane protein YagU involved in acid resistance
MKIGNAVLSGIVATRLMTDAMLSLPAVELPEVDVPGTLGSKINEEVPPANNSPKWQAGLLVHYGLGGLVFPLVFELLVKHVLPGNKLVKSTIWGAFLWVVAETTVMPSLGKGRQFHHAPRAMSYLLGHLVYGATFGILNSLMTLTDN